MTAHPTPSQALAPASADADALDSRAGPGRPQMPVDPAPNAVGILRAPGPAGLARSTRARPVVTVAIAGELDRCGRALFAGDHDGEPLSGPRPRQPHLMPSPLLDAVGKTAISPEKNRGFAPAPTGTDGKALRAHTATACIARAACSSNAVFRKVLLLVLTTVDRDSSNRSTTASSTLAALRLTLQA